MSAETPAAAAELAAQRRRTRKVVGGIIFFTGFMLFAISFGMYWFNRTPGSAGQVFTATVSRVETVADADARIYVRLPAEAAPAPAEFLLPADGFDPPPASGETVSVVYDSAARPAAVRLYNSGLSLVTIVLAIAGFFDLIFGFVVLNLGLPSEWNRREAAFENPDFNPYNRR